LDKPKRKRRFGDRKEGRRIRSLDPLYAFTPFIMKTRGDATNYFSASVELEAIEKYIKKKREEGLKGFGILHIFIAGYVRCVSQYPGVNRFVSGKRIYARNNIEIVMTVKKRMSTTAGETEFKVVFEPTDTINTVYERVNEAIEKIKTEEDSSTDKVAAVLIKLPRPLLSAAIRFFDWLDYHGWLPMSLIGASPFHGSMVITDLGSLGIPPIFHHLYNFGNVPVFIAFGAKRKTVELDKEGKPVEKKYIDYTVATDERICDGYYYAVAFKHFNYTLRNPEMLEAPPEYVVEDID
jgi:hypothetical protein